MNNKNTLYLIIGAIIVILGGYMMFKPKAPDHVSATALPTNGLVGDTTAERAANNNNPNAQLVPPLSAQVPPAPPSGMPLPPANTAAMPIPPISNAPAPTPTNAAPFNPPPTEGAISAGIPPIGSAPQAMPAAPATMPSNGAITAGTPPSGGYPPPANPSTINVITDQGTGTLVNGQNPQVPTSNMPAPPPGGGMNIPPGEGQ